MKIQNAKAIAKTICKEKHRDNIANAYLDVDSKRLLTSNGLMAVLVPCELSEGDVSGPVSPEALSACKDELVCNGSLKVPNGPTFERPTTSHSLAEVLKQVMPSTRGAVTIALNAELLLQIAKAIGAHKNHVCISINPEDSLAPLVVTTSNTAEIPTDEPVAILMPCKL